MTTTGNCITNCACNRFSGQYACSKIF